MSNEDWLPNYQELIDSQPTCDDGLVPPSNRQVPRGG